MIESPASVINPEDIVIPLGRPDVDSNVNSLLPLNVTVLLIAIVISALVIEAVVDVPLIKL